MCVSGSDSCINIPHYVWLQRLSELAYYPVILWSVYSLMNSISVSVCVLKLSIKPLCTLYVFAELGASECGMSHDLLGTEMKPNCSPLVNRTASYSSAMVHSNYKKSCDSCRFWPGRWWLPCDLSMTFQTQVTCLLKHWSKWMDFWLVSWKWMFPDRYWN